MAPETSSALIPIGNEGRNVFADGDGLVVVSEAHADVLGRIVRDTRARAVALGCGGGR